MNTIRIIVLIFCYFFIAINQNLGQTKVKDFPEPFDTLTLEEFVILANDSLPKYVDYDLILNKKLRYWELAKIATIYNTLTIYFFQKYGYNSFSENFPYFSESLYEIEEQIDNILMFYDDLHSYNGLMEFTYGLLPHYNLNPVEIEQSRSVRKE